MRGFGKNIETSHPQTQQPERRNASTRDERNSHYETNISVLPPLPQVQEVTEFRALDNTYYVNLMPAYKNTLSISFLVLYI